jgi:hypothetical protein
MEGTQDNQQKGIAISRQRSFGSKQTLPPTTPIPSFSPNPATVVRNRGFPTQTNQPSNRPPSQSLQNYGVPILEENKQPQSTYAAEAYEVPNLGHKSRPKSPQFSPIKPTKNEEVGTYEVPQYAVIIE